MATAYLDSCKIAFPKLGLSEICEHQVIDWEEIFIPLHWTYLNNPLACVKLVHSTQGLSEV